MKKVGISSTLATFKHRIERLYLKKYRIQLSQQPLDGKIHFEFAQAAFKLGLNDLAFAELRNAEYLNFDLNKVKSLNNKINRSLRDLTKLDVNQYQRFYILQSHLNKILQKKESILDIGGGHGILAQYMSGNQYFLVEPSVNGISGLKLPFGDNCFDAVVTCHVLEHIAPDDRNLFIDELVRVASKNVLIFNPFKNSDLDETERLQLILEVTKAPWAEEHLKYGLPKLEEITDYLSTQGLLFTLKEYGDIYASIATVFMSYFAEKIDGHKLLKINQHLNQNYDQMGHSKYPTNIMIVIATDNKKRH